MSLHKVSVRSVCYLGPVLIGVPGARPLADQITAAIAFPALTAAEIAQIGKVPVAADLANDVITNFGTITDVAIHNAALLERQAVLANSGLRAAIRTAGNAPVLMSALLEGSQQWRNPTANDFYTHFVTNNGNGPLPNTDTMNCWESVLYAFYLAGRKSAANIVRIEQRLQQAVAQMPESGNCSGSMGV